MRWLAHSCVLVALLSGCFLGGSSDLPASEVALGEFEVTLAIPGELKAVNSVTLSAPDLRGQNKIQWVVEEGTRVEEGDKLVEFETTELQQDLETALNNLEVAETKMRQREAQLGVRLGDLENDITRAQLSLKRAEMRVTDSETVPRVERESARLDVQDSTISVDRSRAALESAKLEGTAELQLLALDAKRAQQQVDKVQQRIEKATVLAPSPGLVILPEIWKGGSRGAIAVGDTVWSGSTIVELPDLSQMEVVGWVHEVDAAKVAVGQPVSVVIDAHPDPAWSGTVTKVADLAVKRDRNKKVKHVKVTVSLDETADIMKPGMTVRAEIQVHHEAEALSVPQEAVFHDGEQAMVRVGGFGGWSATPVTLGEANDTHVVVTEGLSEGDSVALVDPEGFERGESPSPGAPDQADE